MQFETIELSHRALASLSYAIKSLVLENALVLAYSQLSAVNETDSCASVMALFSTFVSKTLLKSSHIERISIILPSGNIAVVFRVMFLHYKITKNAASSLIYNQLILVELTLIIRILHKHLDSDSFISIY